MSTTNVSSLKSFRNLCNQSGNLKINNWFLNVGLSYFEELLENYPTFYSYIYEINKHKYISDLEFWHIFEPYTRPSLSVDSYLTKNGVFEDNPMGVKITVNKGILLKNNYANAGHSFGNLTNQIYHIKQHFDLTDDVKIIIPEHLVKLKFFYSLILIFFNKDQIFVLTPKTFICCNSLYIMNDNSHVRPEPIKFVLEKLSLNLPTELSTQNFKNIFLIKSSITENSSPTRAFSCEYNEYFIAKGFNHVIPEKYDIMELFRIINNAENIVFSWGCVDYLNRIFCSDKCKRFVIGHESYSHEYQGCAALLTSPGFVGFLPTNLDNNTISLLDEKLKDYFLL